MDFELLPDVSAGSMPRVSIGGEGAGEALTEYCALLFDVGPELALAEVTGFERELAEQPETLESRAKLMGFYLALARESGDPEAAKAAFHRHHVWVVRNRPGSGLAAALTLWIHTSFSESEHREITALWVDCALSRSGDPQVYGNAARFLWIRDHADLAVACLRRAIALDPEDPRWAEELAQHLLEEARACPSHRRPEHFAEIHRYLDFALRRMTHPMRQDELMLPLLLSATLAGKAQVAESFATSILARGIDEEDEVASTFRVHQAHLALAQIAAMEGAVERAASHLAQASKTLSYHSIPEFLFEAELSQRFVAAGHHAIVLTYWQCRANIYDAGAPERRKIEDWLAVLGRGGKPTFDVSRAA
ncbi:MAG: hypothetical protein E2O39_08500 [Planctomycetota bacterium]|nr:MAG: hypothetical protein E2O39_08500 [Planctomycetota bacterium]